MNNLNNQGLIELRSRLSLAGDFCLSSHKEDVDRMTFRLSTGGTPLNLTVMSSNNTNILDKVVANKVDNCDHKGMM